MLNLPAGRQVVKLINCYMKNIFLILQELFYVLTGALIIFCLLELIWPGVILAHININFVLLLWLIIGIINLIIYKEKLNDKRSNY